MIFFVVFIESFNIYINKCYEDINILITVQCSLYKALFVTYILGKQYKTLWITVKFNQFSKTMSSNIFSFSKSILFNMLVNFNMLVLEIKKMCFVYELTNQTVAGLAYVILPNIRLMFSVCTGEALGNWSTVRHNKQSRRDIWTG